MLEKLRKVQNGTLEVECPICLLDIQDNRYPVSTECGHVFCESCMDIHIKYSPNLLAMCPLCTETIDIIIVLLGLPKAIPH